MFNKKGLMLMGVALFGLAACAQNPAPATSENPAPAPTTTEDDGWIEQNSSSFDVPVLNLAIVGSKWGSWDPAKAGAEGAPTRFTCVDSSLYTLSTDVAENDEFKFCMDASWGTQYGMEDLNWEKSELNGLFGDAKLGDFKEGASNRSNCKPVLAGHLDIEFHPYEFSTPMDGCTAKFIFKFTPATAA